MLPKTFSGFQVIKNQKEDKKVPTFSRISFFFRLCNRRRRLKQKTSHHERNCALASWPMWQPNWIKGTFKYLRLRFPEVSSYWLLVLPFEAYSIMRCVLLSKIRSKFQIPTNSFCVRVDEMYKRWKSCSFTTRISRFHTTKHSKVPEKFFFLMAHDLLIDVLPHWNGWLVRWCWWEK